MALLNYIAIEYCYRPKAVKEKIFMLNRIERRINVWEEVGQGFHLEKENC